MRTAAAHGRIGHVHEAGFYSSDAEFLALIMPFVSGGIAAGEPVVIGYDNRKCNLLRAELARPDMVNFIADTRLYATPAGAIEAYRQQFERHVAAGVEQIRIAGDVPHEGNGGRFAGWDRYESAVNVVWQDYPVYSRCLYDATTVADSVRDVVLRTHRRLLTADGGATASPRYQEVADFERLPTAPDPLEATPPTVALINAWPRKARHWVGEAAHGRVDAATRQELLFAVSEAVLNAHLHGRRPITVTGWTGPDRIVVRVHDNGPGPADPLTGLIPTAGSTAGRGLGLWIIHQFTNIDIALLAGTDGFTVRLCGGQQTRPAAAALVPGTTSSSGCPGNDEARDLVGVGQRAGRFRPRPALEQQITALEQPRPADGPPAEFRRGARAALRWLLAGGPAPLTETVTGQSPPSPPVVRELAAAEALIYQWRSSRREYGRGVQHALMWAQYATATPPSPTPSPRRAPDR
jgi:anti-sigma regulatory factor (Ser/Thr protein kinase)